MLLAVLGLGFGLLQMLNRPEPAPALLSLGQAEPAAAAATASGSIGTNGGASSASLVSAGLVPSVQVVAPAAVGSAPGEATRAIQTSAKVLQANYTIAAGDTLVQIALRFNTTVDRIQAFNNLADPRALRIGTRLVIPPPL